MRAAIYMLATVAVAGLATAGTHGSGHSGGHSGGHHSGNPASTSASNPAGNPFAPPGISTPVRQPTIPPPSATPAPPPGVNPMPTQFTHPGQITDQQFTHPSQMTDQHMVNSGHPRGNNPSNNFQQRVPPASRGVGNPGKPDCSRMRGVDKAECERRDTVRDDLPAGVTTTQPER